MVDISDLIRRDRFLREKKKKKKKKRKRKRKRKRKNIRS